MGDVNLEIKLNNLIENVSDINKSVDESSRVIADNGDWLKGKNLLNPILETTTFNGVTCTNNGDGTYTLNGTANANAYFDIIPSIEDTKAFFSPYKGKTLRLVGCPSGGGNGKYAFTLQGGEKDGIGKNDYGAGLNVIISDNIDTFNTVLLKIFIFSGQTVNNLIFKPMIVDAELYPDVTYDDFEPYVKSNVELASNLATLIETLKSKGVID